MHFMRQTFTKDTVKVKVKNVSKHETNLDEKLNTYFWWKIRQKVKHQKAARSFALHFKLPLRNFQKGLHHKQ